MPTLPVPSGGSNIHGGDLPVSDGNDVLEEFADTHKAPITSPVRDDICDAFAVSHIVYQDVASAALAQTDPVYATDDFLVSKALEHSVTPLPGEDPEHLRPRIYAVPEVVTPDAIVDLVNSLIAPYTVKECQLIEPELDGWFVSDGTPTTWDSFIGSQPRYPDRYYEDDEVENGGFFLSNNASGDSIVSAGFYRNFHLRIPPLDSADTLFAFVIDAADEIMSIGDGSDTSGAESDGSVATSVFADGGLTEEELFAAIVGGVEAIKGQSISWSVLIDESL